MTAYHLGDVVEIVRLGVIVEVDPKDPARYGLGRPGRFADAYFRTDDENVQHVLVSESQTNPQPITEETTVALSRVVVLSYDGFTAIVAGSARPDDEQRILDAIDSAAARAEGTEETIRCVVVARDLEVRKVALWQTDLDHVVWLVMDANRRAHLDPVG